MVKPFKNYYSITLEAKVHSMNGWNWGKTEFGRSELAFNVQNRPAFEVPYTKITNTNLAGKMEVAVEFTSQAGGKDTETNGHLTSLELDDDCDELVEMRFYVPGTSAKKEMNEDGDEMSVEGSDAEEQNAANVFYDMLMEKAEIGEVAGDTFATFPDILHLTPRSARARVKARFEIHTDRAAEDASMWTCTRLRSAFAGRRTTTRYRTTMSRSLCCSPSPMNSILLSPLAWILLCVKVKPAIPSL